MSEPLVPLRPTNADVIVRDPVTNVPLRAEGDVKPLNAYWLRRLADRDVEQLPTASQAAAPGIELDLDAVRLPTAVQIAPEGASNPPATKRTRKAQQK